MSLQAYVIAGIGFVVPGARAYKWFDVKQSSNFFLCGTETDISLISRRTASSSAFDCVLVAEGAPFAAPTSTLLFLCAGSLLPCS